MSCQHLKKLQPVSLYIAWLIAVAMTLGSFYFGEIKHEPICNLCWYQRICIYPLAIILGIATYRQDAAIKRYTLPLVFIGALLAFYQYLMQMIPGFAPFPVCGLGPDCAVATMKFFGFITMPLLSLIGCIIIAILLLTNCGRKVCT